MKKSLSEILAQITVLSIFAGFIWLMLYGGTRANGVLLLPEGFVKLQSSLEENNLRLSGFETQIVILNADDIGIYGTGIKNSDFIVRYWGELYVNEEKIKEIAEIAPIASELRHKAYALGETVEIRGAGATRYFIAIDSLEESETVPLGTDILTTFIVKYSITSNIPSHKDLVLMAQVETLQGARVGSFDSIDIGTAKFQTRSVEGVNKVTAMILRSPDYPGLKYRVDVDK